MKGWGTRYLLMSTLGISTDLGHGEVGLDLERGPTTVQAPVTTSADPMESSRVKISHPECSPGMQLKRWSFYHPSVCLWMWATSRRVTLRKKSLCGWGSPWRANEVCLQTASLAVREMSYSLKDEPHNISLCEKTSFFQGHWRRTERNNLNTVTWISNSRIWNKQLFWTFSVSPTALHHNLLITETGPGPKDYL